jgi:hypothetical protein
MPTPLTTVETSFGTGSRRRGVFTWAQLAALATGNIAGDTAEVSDLSYAVFFWDGARWRPRAPVLLFGSAAAVPLTGNTAETALRTVPILAGLMGLNGGIEVRHTWSYTNSANAKTMRVRHGGIGGTQFFNRGDTTTASSGFITRFRNRGSAASQVGSLTAAGGAPSATGLPTGAIDSTVAQDLVVSGQLAVGTETLTLEMLEVWLLP